MDRKERVGERIDAHVRTLHLEERTVDLFTHRDNRGELWDRIELGKSGWCDGCGCPRTGPGWRRDLAELKPMLPAEVSMPHIYLCEQHTSGLEALDEDAEARQEAEEVFPILSVRLN